MIGRRWCRRVNGYFKGTISIAVRPATIDKELQAAFSRNGKFQRHMQLRAVGYRRRLQSANAARPGPTGASPRLSLRMPMQERKCGNRENGKQATKCVFAAFHRVT